MTRAFGIYRGLGGDPPQQPAVLPQRRHRDATHPRGYLADQGLVDAANTAILLGQPLLLTGEPGTGKTQFAASLSWELGLGPDVLRFDAKSYSKSKDLFYTVDTLSWFQAAQAAAPGSTGIVRPANFITYNALGRALLHANDPGAISELVPSNFVHPGSRRRSVVLVDEIDKAPRDLPNDILGEIEELGFNIPELQNARVDAPPEFAPMVVFTSNSERDLPDAFLRRCIYYDIPFPDPERLRRIVEARLGEGMKDDEFISDALGLFHQLRSSSAGLRKQPATAELLGWLMALRAQAPVEANPLRKIPGAALAALGALIKTNDDQRSAQRVVEAWIRRVSEKKP